MSRRLWVVAGAVAALIVATVSGYSLGSGTAADSATGLGAHSAAPSRSGVQPSAATPSTPEPSRSPALVVTGGAAHGGPDGSINGTGSDDVALTFDDGPDPVWTPKVLDLLSRYRVKATFCMIGSRAAEYPDLVARVVAEGHSLCNHSWNHEIDLGATGKENIRDNLVRTNDAIHAAAPGADIDFYRQPGGVWTDDGVAVAAELGMSGLHWSVDPRDWDKSVSATSIRHTLLDEVQPGGIVLLHDGAGHQRAGFSALRRILGDLTSRFQLVALA